MARSVQPAKGPATKAAPASRSQRPASKSQLPAASSRKQLMENEILEHATRLFAARGFAGTSLQDIAESMGLKRPALYYYFKSKDALLDRLIAEATSGPAQDLKTLGAARDLPASERLHAISCRIVEWVVSHRDMFLLLVRSEAELSSASAKHFDNGRREALDAVTDVVKEGVASGEFRRVDPTVAALGVWGICNWVAWWYRPDGGQSVDAIAEQLAGMAVAGVQRPDLRGRGPATPKEAVAALREDLERLEAVLDRGRAPKARK